MRSRVLEPELMDDPSLDQDQHFQALSGLQRLNRWTKLTDLIWRPIEQFVRENDATPLRILDIATGSADVPIQLAQRAKQRGMNLEIEASDISPQALQFAEDACQKHNASVKLHALDVLSEPIPDGYDIVMCSTFLHHLTTEQAEIVLANMVAAAKQQVILVDLIRSHFNWLQVWIATRLLSRSPVVHFDGPQSIRAAFTISEIESIAASAQLSNYRLTRHWPCRFMLVGNCHD